MPMHLQAQRRGDGPVVFVHGEDFVTLVTHKLIVTREEFVVHLHVFNEVSRVHVQGIVYLACVQDLSIAASAMASYQYRGELRNLASFLHEIIRRVSASILM